MNDYKEYPENMNTAENTTETEAVKQTGTVILPPAGEQKAKPAASNGDSKASFRVRTVAALCIVCSLLGGIVSTGSYALYQYYNSDSEELETTPLDPSGSNPNAVNTSASSDGSNQNGDVTINVENVTSPATAVAEKVSPSIVGIRVTTITSYGPVSYTHLTLPTTSRV